MQKIANREIFLLFFVKKGQELKENLYFCSMFREKSGLMMHG